MIERYQTDDMKRIWSDQNKYNTWLDVELAVVEILVEDGVVTDIGCNKNYDKNINVIDCSNLFMLQGFVDSHGHMTHLGKNQYEVDLRDCKSEFEVVKKIKNFLKLNSNIFWRNGGGWNQENFETTTNIQRKKCNFFDLLKGKTFDISF